MIGLHYLLGVATVPRVRSSPSLFTNQSDAIDTLCYIPLQDGRSKNGWADLWADPSGFWGMLAN
jgi:hypothetical protein